MTSLFGGGGLSQKMSKSDGGEWGSAYLIIQKWRHLLLVTFGGEGGVSQKVTKSDWGRGGWPKETSLTVGHFFGGEGNSSQKVTKSDGGGGFGLFSKPKVTSFMDSP